MINMSIPSLSPASSASTDANANLVESGEEVSLLIWLKKTSSLLMSKLAAISAETESNEQLQVLQAKVNSVTRNDNSTANANESLPLPLTSQPSVAGQLAGFFCRELLGWEEQSSAGASVSTQGNSSETVVQQPKQEAIPPCPICRKAFPSLERLQTHASNCGIENDEQPDDPLVFP